MLTLLLQIVPEDNFLGFAIFYHYCIFEIGLAKILFLGYHRIWVNLYYRFIS
jgi:hypothetical protein